MEARLMEQAGAAAIAARPGVAGAAHSAPVAPRRRLASLAGGHMLLPLGTLASGVLAYAFNVLAARALGPAAYGPVAVLWAGMFLVSVVLFRPLEQTLTRAVAERLARGQDARPVLRSVGRMTLATGAASTVAILLAWGPLSSRLFAGRGALTVALALGVAGYAASYYVRGAASGMHWFEGYGVLLLADGAVRVALLAPLAFVASPTVAAVAIAGAASGGAVAPLLWHALRRGGQRAAPLRARLAGHSAPDAPFRIRSVARFAGPAAVIAAADQVLVSGGPLLIAIAGGPGAMAAAGTVFAATMLVRAPVFLFQGLAASLLPTLTRLHSLEDEAGFRRHVARTCAVLAAAGAVLAVGALTYGPEAMRLLFGEGFDVERGDLAVLCAGVGAYLVAATLSQAVLARDQAGRAAVVWSVVAAVFVAVELLVPGAPLHRVSLAFGAAAAAMVVLLGAVVAGGGGRKR